MQRQDTFSGPIALEIQAPAVTAKSSDEALMELIVERSRDAMRALYVRHQVRVFRFVLGLTGNRVVAEDITGDVFLDVWRQATSFQGRSSVATWLLAIARFKAISAMRRKTSEELDEAVSEMAADPAEGAEAMMERNGRTAILHKCLQQLTPIQREVILLAYLQERSVDEVAEIVGVPANTVKTRMFHARRSLAELLKAAGIASATA